MQLWKIEQEIQNCVDPETGELDEERFNELELARETKIENIALLCKENKALLALIADEEKNLKSRKEQIEKANERLTALLDNSLCGEKFQTARCAISWRTSESVYISAKAVIPDDYLTVKTTVTPSKTALKAAIKNGELIPGVEIQLTRNIQLK